MIGNVTLAWGRLMVTFVVKPYLILVSKRVVKEMDQIFILMQFRLKLFSTLRLPVVDLHLRDLFVWWGGGEVGTIPA